MRSDPAGGDGRRAQAWHTLSASQALQHLDSDGDAGLREAVASERLARSGRNRLTEAPERPIWLRFLDQFRSLLIGMLIAAALVALAVGDLQDAVVILFVVVLNGILGFLQEQRAETAAAALKGMLARTARVCRGGRIREIAADLLVPGDVVLLEAGDRVPADGRIIDAYSVEMDESSLTGESQAVGKNAGAVLVAGTPLAERRNCAYMNTSVTRGRARMVVTDTGMRTEIGRLAGMLHQAQPVATPLQVQLDGLGKRLALVAIGVVSAILLADLVRGEPIASSILDAIALAVAAIPEGLPAVVTVTLALAMHRMAGHRAIVRKLSAVETLGCTTVICSDKTGTLTHNKMAARAVWVGRHRLDLQQISPPVPSGEHLATARGENAALERLALAALLCNDAQADAEQQLGDPTEVALLDLGAHAGVDRSSALARFPRIAEVPFEASTKFMATFHSNGDRVLMFVKGAPDVVLGWSSGLLGANAPILLDSTARQQVESMVEELGRAGMRVLALAEGAFPADGFDPAGDLRQTVADLTLLGLVGISDPPRAEAREAISLCRNAGIQVKMVTGDHRATALAIAQELGIDGEVVTGADLERMSDAALADRLEGIGVIARVSPEHKLRIVQSLQNRGHVVAMTGDGVNDAPALKRADIGVAMGITGTEVSRQAASMVLTDDNFATIVGAVKEGRTVYENIIKFVRFQLSTNIGAIFTIAGATFLGLHSPLTAIQILWINIIMDGPPAMTLGVDPPPPGIMRRPPRRREEAALSGKRLGRLIFLGLVMAAGTLWIFQRGLKEGDLEHALTLAFTTFVLFQVFNAFNARVESESAFNRNFLRNGKLWMALGLVVGLQAVAVHWPPAQRVFHTMALSGGDWLLCTSLAATVLLIEEARKLVLRWLPGMLGR